MNNLTIRELWPEDPRFGEAYVKPPLGGAYSTEYVDELNAQVDEIKQLVERFKLAYPDCHWWTQEFVEENPEVALLLQSLHQDLLFSSMFALETLIARVSESSGAIIDTSVSREIQIARLAFQAVSQKSDGGKSLRLTTEIMTDGDRLELGLLLNGISRIVVLGS